MVDKKPTRPRNVVTWDVIFGAFPGNDNWLSINTDHGEERRDQVERKLLGSRGGDGGERGPGVLFLVILAFVLKWSSCFILSLFQLFSKEGQKACRLLLIQAREYPGRDQLSFIL